MRSTHEGERSGSRTGRPRVFRAPASTGAQGSHVPRPHPEAAALGPGQCGGTRCFRGRGRNLGVLLQTGRAPASPEQGRGGGAGGPAKAAPAPQPAVPAQHHGQEEGRGGRAGASRPFRGQRALIGAAGPGAHPHTCPQVQGRGPGPPTKAPLREFEDKKEKESPGPQEQHRKAL